MPLAPASGGLDKKTGRPLPPARRRRTSSAFRPGALAAALVLLVKGMTEELPQCLVTVVVAVQVLMAVMEEVQMALLQKELVVLELQTLFQVHQ